MINLLATALRQGMNVGLVVLLSFFGVSAATYGVGPDQQSAGERWWRRHETNHCALGSIPTFFPSGFVRSGKIEPMSIYESQDC